MNENLFKACRSVCMLPTVVASKAPPPKVGKFQHFNRNFLIDYRRDFSVILHTCTRPLVDFLVSIRPGSFLSIFDEFLK